MKITQTFILFLAISWMACKSTKPISATTYQTGRLTYAIDVDSENEIVQEKFGTVAVVEFNQELLKLSKNDKGSGFEFQLIELQQNKTWNYLDFLGNKFRIPENELMIPKMGTPIFHDEFKTIAGFKCQKMTAPMGDGQMEAFITKEINANYCPYLDVVGFAISYSLPLPIGKVTYTATQFENMVPTLSIDNNYTTYSSIREFQLAIQKNTDNLIGQSIDELNIKDVDGNYFKKENLNKKITVFNFWFTSCAPCITEIPDLNKLKEKYRNQAVQFLAITFDEEAQVKPFLEKHPFEFQIFPNQKELINQFKIHSFPTTFVTDKSGIIIHSESGGSFSIFEDLDLVIDTALKK